MGQRAGGGATTTSRHCLYETVLSALERLGVLVYGPDGVLGEAAIVDGTDLDGYLQFGTEMSGQFGHDRFRPLIAPPVRRVRGTKQKPGDVVLLFGRS